MPLFLYLLIFLTFFGTLAVMANLQKFGLKQIFGYPTSDLRQRAINVTSTVTILLIILGIIFVIGTQLFELSAVKALWIAAILWGAAFTWFLIVFIRNKRKPGKIILDVAPVPFKNFILLCSLLPLGLGILGPGFGFLNDYLSAGQTQLVFVLFGITGMAFFLMLASGRLQIKEQGLFIYTALLKWSQIESYSWEAENGSYQVFKFVVKGWQPTFLRNGVLSIPVEKKKDFADLVERYVPQIDTLNLNHA